MGNFAKQILDKYQEADSFELIGSAFCYQEGDIQACVSITKAKADELINQLIDEEKNNLLFYYEKFSITDKQQLPSFETLIANIGAEAKNHFLKVINKQLKEDESPYTCDEFGQGHMMYTRPEQLWHFYHFFDGLYQSVDPILHKMVTTEQKLDPLEVFNDVKYRELKVSLLSYRLSFSWHCTKTFQPALLYRFSLDENSLEWLKSVKHPFDFERLEDFALYRGDRLLYSTCTHEHFEEDRRQ